MSGMTTRLSRPAVRSVSSDHRGLAADQRVGAGHGPDRGPQPLHCGHRRVGLGRVGEHGVDPHPRPSADGSAGRTSATPAVARAAAATRSAARGRRDDQGRGGRAGRVVRLDQVLSGDRPDLLGERPVAGQAEAEAADAAGQRDQGGRRDEPDQPGRAADAARRCPATPGARSPRRDGLADRARGTNGQNTQRPNSTTSAGSSVVMTANAASDAHGADRAQAPGGRQVGGEQAQQGEADRGGRGGDGGERAAQRERHRPVPVGVAAQLLAVAGDQQQGVVDADPEDEDREDALALEVDGQAGVAGQQVDDRAGDLAGDARPRAAAAATAPGCGR